MLSLCGIDEAGRGPLAGPLCIAGVIINKKIIGLNDSKKLSEKKREILFESIKKNCSYHIVFKSAKQIDNLGLSFCLKSSIEEIISILKNKTNNFLIDGNTAFGIKDLTYKIKADASVLEVSAASILAKVSRDRYMYLISKQYPEYTFSKHKGYGTKQHINQIKEFGYCQEHRKSYKIKSLINIIN